MFLIHFRGYKKIRLPSNTQLIDIKDIIDGVMSKIEESQSAVGVAT